MYTQKSLRENIIKELSQHSADLDGFLEDILSPQEIETIDERIKIYSVLEKHNAR
jgi:uncharacterized protein YerC